MTNPYVGQEIRSSDFCSLMRRINDLRDGVDTLHRKALAHHVSTGYYPSGTHTRRTYSMALYNEECYYLYQENENAPGLCYVFKDATDGTQGSTPVLNFPGQDGNAMAVLPDGSIAVAALYSTGVIYLQKFDSSGVELWGVFIYEPAIAGLDGGTFGDFARNNFLAASATGELWIGARGFFYQISGTDGSVLAEIETGSTEIPNSFVVDDPGGGVLDPGWIAIYVVEGPGPSRLVRYWYTGDPNPTLLELHASGVYYIASDSYSDPLYVLRVVDGTKMISKLNSGGGVYGESPVSELYGTPSGWPPMSGQYAIGNLCVENGKVVLLCNYEGWGYLDTYTAAELGAFEWFAYQADRKESIGEQPADTALYTAFSGEGAEPVARNLTQMRTAIEELIAEQHYKNPATLITYSFLVPVTSYPNNLLAVAMGDRTDYGATGGARGTWTRTEAQMIGDGPRDIDIGEIRECVETLEDAWV